MQITYGQGGWVSVANIGLPGLLYIRYGPAGIGEMVLAPGAGPLTAAHLRKLPLSAINTVVASRPDLFSMGLDADPPDIQAVLEQIVPRRPQRAADTTARLTAPTGGLTPEFLRDVGNAYTAALTRGERPNKALAAQVGFPPAKRQPTVERWVYLARKAGYLPIERRGSGTGSTSWTGSASGTASQ